MHERMQSSRKVRVSASGLVALLVTLGAATAVGQTPPPGAAPSEAPPPSAAAGEMSPPAEQPPAAAAHEAPPPTAPVKPEPPPVPPLSAPTPAEIPFGTVPKGPVPPAPPPAMPNIDFGGRLRSAVRFQGLSDQKSLNDVSASLYADLYASGQINRMWRWLLAFTSNEYGGATGQPSNGPISVLDAMAGFTPLPEFQIYAGRMLVMADRYAPSGPWSLDEWIYPGFFGGGTTQGVPPGVPPAVPKAGPSGRDIGVTAWGVPLGGHIKYYAGAYQLQDPSLSPLFSGRVQVSLLSPEPGWFHRTTYYGDRDLVSVGVGGQYQKNGSVMAVMGTPPPPAMIDNYHELNADLIVEKRIGDLGALSLEGAYYNFSGTYQAWKWSMVAAIAYNSPVIPGVGKLRPSFRYQQAQAKQVTATSDNFDPTRVYDVQLTYAVMHWFTHVVVNYRHYDVVWASTSAPAPAASPPHSTGNMVIVGVQLWDP